MRILPDLHTLLAPFLVSSYVFQLTDPKCHLLTDSFNRILLEHPITQRFSDSVRHYPSLPCSQAVPLPMLTAICAAHSPFPDGTEQFVQMDTRVVITD